MNFENELKTNSELIVQCAHLTQNSSFLTPHAFRLGSGVRERDQLGDCPAGGDPEAREKLQKQWERS
jgi:hypothetical protein